ncbi:MAG: hypothetical protein P8X97_04830 [Candidatus Bathyarchaeota archaeon]
MGFEKITHSHVCHIATSDSVKQYKLRKRIAWLSNKEGRKQEFISLYIPSTASMENIIRNLKNKSKFIKLQDERANDRVKDVIKHIIKHLKEKKEIQKNGQAIFAGTLIDEKQENAVLAVEEIIPPEPIVAYFFEIDHHFHLEQLRKMLRNPRVVGFIALDSKEASFGLLNGDHFEVLKTITSGIAGKSGKGGQSQRRYERETKTDFVTGNYLHYELKDVLLDIYDTQSADKKGLTELLEKSSEPLKNLCFPEEKMLMKRLLHELHKENGLAIYGLNEVLAAINKGAVEVVLVIDNTEFSEMIVTCKVCGLSKKKILTNNNKPQAIQEMISIPCEKCNSKEYEVEEKDIIDVLEDAASKTDAKVEIISTESKEKDQLRVLGGIAALLRYT